MKILVSIILVLNSNIFFGQIPKPLEYSELYEILSYDNEEVRFGGVIFIEENVKKYLGNKLYLELKISKHLDEKNRVINSVEDEYDKNNLIRTYSKTYNYENDKLKKMISSFKSPLSEKVRLQTKEFEYDDKRKLKRVKISYSKNNIKSTIVNIEWDNSDNKVNATYELNKTFDFEEIEFLDSINAISVWQKGTSNLRRFDRKIYTPLEIQKKELSENNFAKYDSFGNLISYKNRNQNCHFVYNYDDKNNWTFRIEYLTDNSGKILRREIRNRKIEYVEK